MRIIISFLAGLGSFFFLSEIITPLARLNHSIFGLALIVIGTVGSFLTGYDPLRQLFSFFSIGAGVGLVSHHFLTKRYLLFEGLEKRFILRHESAIERFLEILPGALMWLALTSPIWLSFTLPFAVAYLIILADIYWLITAVRIAVLIYIGYQRIEQAKGVNWRQRLKKDFPKDFPKYYHLLILPTYKESLDVLRPTFEAIVASDYPAKKIFLAVGFEERDNPEKISACKKALREIAPKIGGVFITIHPFGLPGEVPGPGSNRNYIVRNATHELEKRGIVPENVFVTTLDADFVIHPRFLAGALHKYLSQPEEIRHKRTFTGVFLYHNNYWQASTPMRLVASGTAFWQLSEMVGSDKYINFSSLSINLKSLLEIGLWIPNKVNDDSGFFWKAYYHFEGDYKVIPHYLPISADAVMDVTLVKTFQNQYLQLKRWAYGAEHIPFIITKYFTTKNMNFWDKTDKLIFIMWSYFKWGTLALFIAFAGFLVPIINKGYAQSVVAYNLPVISSWILTGAFIGLFTTIYVHEKTVPKRPANWSPLIKIWSYAQWALVPIVLVTIASIPAIDAQTTLMIGKYLEFRTTTKVRTKL
jgi:cellulose synthase/poly-beta-1,6-N-acetylglucosamine synthase-like glycosyltransferase